MLYGTPGRGTILACLALQAACAPGSEAPDAGTPDPTLDADFAPFDAELEALLADEGLDGATVSIVHRDAGVVHEQAYGSFEMDRVSLFASSTKVLTVGVIARLADQGLVDLDAPISTYASGWGEREHDPSLAQMLSNSSGMVGLADDPIYAPYLCQYIETGSLLECGETIYTSDDAEDVVPPDTAFRYGGGQWQLAGAIAEEVSGKAWDALLEDTYRTPCELDVLGFSNPYQRSLTEGGIEAAFVYPAYVDGSVDDIPETDNPNMEGGGYSTAGAYGRVLLMHLRGGECPGGTVLSEASVARMQEDRLASWGGSVEVGSFDGYGMGWWLDSAEPGLTFDPGSFGAMPWMDTNRGYAVMIMLEGEASLGFEAMTRLRPLLETAMDESTLIEG